MVRPVRDDDAVDGAPQSHTTRYVEHGALWIRTATMPQLLEARNASLERRRNASQELRRNALLEGTRSTLVGATHSGNGQLDSNVNEDSGCGSSLPSELQSLAYESAVSKLTETSDYGREASVYFSSEAQAQSERKVLSIEEAWTTRIELLIVWQDKDGDNEIILAAIKGLEVYVLLLIKCLILRKCPWYLNLSNDLGQTILYLCVYKNLEKATLMLVETDEVELDIRDNNGNTPLHIACQKGFIGQVKILTKELPKPRARFVPRNMEPTGEVERQRVTGKELAELRNYKGWNALHVAVLNSNIQIVEYLVKTLKMDPNTPGGSRGMTPCHIAVENDDVPMLIYLIRVAKVDLNCQTYDKWSPVQFALLRKQDHTVKLLVQYDAHVGDIRYCQDLLKEEASAQTDENDDSDEENDDS